MIYHLFRAILKFSVFQFFGRIIIRGTPVSDGPVVYASNHPNQAIDPFLLGAIVPVSPHFLAKSTLFKNPFLRWLFRSLHMIPIYRRSDEENTAQNLESFAEAIKVLVDGKAIVIFPEGTSSERRVLLQLKTGAARIALQSESQADFALGLKIQPVSITYSSPRAFQSSVTLIFHEPIQVSDYKNQYGTEQRTAVKDLTASLESSIRSITPEVKEESHQKLVQNIATLLAPSSTDDFVLISRIADGVEKASLNNPSLVESVNSRILEFTTRCKTDGLYVEDFVKRARSLGAYFRFAVVAVGAFFYYIPYKLVDLAIAKTVKDPHNYASAKVGFGVAFFTFWLVCSLFLLYSLGLSASFLPLSAVVLIAFGILTNRWTNEARSIFFGTLAPRRYGKLCDRYISLCAELYEHEKNISR